MRLQFSLDLSQTVGEDNVQRRELHVFDGNGDESVIVVDPTSVSTDFIVPIKDGGQGSTFLVDFDQANNASSPSNQLTFDTSTPPDTTGPTTPTISNLRFVGIVPDEPTPPQSTNIASSNSGSGNRPHRPTRIIDRRTKK